MAKGSTYPNPRVVDPAKKYPQPHGPGPHGRPLCRWCHLEVPAGRRRTFCGAECHREFLYVINFGVCRRATGQRDQWICQACGTDCAKVRRVLRCVMRSRRVVLGADGRHISPYSVAAWAARLMMLGDPLRSQWEADHVVPRYQGGPDHPTNLRVLCVACHRQRTREQAAERAAERRINRQGAKARRKKPLAVSL